MNAWTENNTEEEVYFNRMSENDADESACLDLQSGYIRPLCNCCHCMFYFHTDVPGFK